MKNISGKYEIGDNIFLSKYLYKNDENTSGKNHLFVIIDEDKI